MSPRKGRAAVPLTEARKQLFQLVEDLLAGRTDRVALSHRAHEEHVLLVRATDVARMEAELAALRRRNAVSEPRPLYGYMTVDGDVDEIIAENRSRQNALFEAKMRDIFGDPPPPDPAGEPAPDASSTRQRRRSPRTRKSAP
jgi:hypothetical protein